MDSMSLVIQNDSHTKTKKEVHENIFMHLRRVHNNNTATSSPAIIVDNPLDHIKLYNHTTYFIRYN